MLPPKRRYQSSKETISMLATASPVKGLAIQDDDVDLGARAPIGLSVTGADLAPTVEKIKEFVTMGLAVNVVAVDENRASGIVEMFSNHDLLLTREKDRYGRHSEGVSLMIGDLPTGFVAPRSGVAFIPASAFFGEGRRRRSRMAHAQFNAAVADLSQLQDGGLVVHRLHGVGRYEGLQRLTIQGGLGSSKGGRASERPKAMADYLKLSYRNGALLYLPATDLGSLSRYIGAKEGQKVKLDKLGGTTWESRKRRVRDSVLQMAQGLISRAAQRELARRDPLPPRGELMQLFEARFPYQETPDQRDAIAAIESDFSRPVPMDRLVVGDVGFGKTEVAMRATMRMVEAGKQVAVLVPTTVLAMQHAERFTERFKPFDMRVELLSRFRSGSEIKNIHRDLLKGDIDIVVGTTQLLGKSVRYHDLGLLVVDEEHRYGVRQKSRLSNLADGLDILSLSATPIPRTLQMGLTGMRSLSTITTPPASRLSIQTSLGKYSEARIRDAVMSEMERKGQVFFVHNKVVEIEEMATQLRDLMPEVRIAVGHGQMEAVELEDVLLRFMRREIDLLLSSTIIESGIDLPNVNTIIINDAHLFGLSQLYQLRGRVGRGDKRGRCLMVLPETVSKGARRRLSVLLDNTALGSGLQVALADLEIRGAGNLLGAAQSGNIAEVGYEMWLELLTAAVSDAKGEQARSSIEVSVEVPVDCFIPATTIHDTAERLGWYQRLAKERVLELDASEEAMENQFGELPEPLRNLVGSHRTRALCQGLGIVRCSWLKVRVELALHPLTRIDDQTVKRFQRSHPNRLTERISNGIRMLDVVVIDSEEQKRFHFLRWLLSQLSAASRPPKIRLP
jgi:transcription-repair coupling factor (superfamily II helicase)